MKNYRPHLIVALLLVACFGVAAHLEVWFQSFSTADRTSVIGILIGDSRRLFANHFFAKADAYFHSGYYPTIFDAPLNEPKSHMEQAATGEAHERQHDHTDEHEGQQWSFLGPPRDWIDKFGRNFFPSEHSHMERAADEREILPWLNVTAELDPQKIEAYVVAAFTLRTKLGKIEEAEQFLRQGLRANPDSPEILLELGKIRLEDRKDPNGARNLWELGLRKWQEDQRLGLKLDELVHAQLVGLLARLEETDGNYERAIVYLKQLKEISTSNKDSIQQQITDVEGKLNQRR